MAKTPAGTLEDTAQAGVLPNLASFGRDGSRVGWSKVKDRSWYQRESWRFERLGAASLGNRT
jgi:hypothetical protein